MKTKAITTIILTLLLVSMLSTAFVAPVVATEVDDNLVGRWHFDEGSGKIAYDSSGYGNDGMLSGGAFGDAFEFDSLDEMVWMRWSG